jgi:phosphoribosylamine--glycine ligase
LVLIPDRVDVVDIGKDARTDALGRGLAASRRLGTLTSISELHPPGMLDRAARFLGGVSPTQLDPIIDFLRVAPPDLAVIGPEDPLAAGIVDRLEDELGIACFGPRSALAKVESSKCWTRELVAESGLAGNPEFRIIRRSSDIRPYLEALGEFVVKPDGLTGGKGVRVSGEHLGSMEEAVDYAAMLLDQDGVVLIEERLDGEEFSLQTITDGSTVVHCPVVQDHKRAYAGDTGPNTGGMGSYSCSDHSLPFLTAPDLKAAQEINAGMIGALGQKTRRPYRGVLYGGFMATADGVRLIEYNCRFGDPEAMNVLSVLSSDLVELCWATASGQLGRLNVRFEPRATVCKYLVPDGYPAAKVAGEAVHVPAELAAWSDPSVRVYWASVNRDAPTGQVRLTGSRSLAVLGIGATLAEAEERAESGARMVSGPLQHREDIGTRALVERRVAHMRRLRSSPSLGAEALDAAYAGS